MAEKVQLVDKLRKKAIVAARQDFFTFVKLLAPEVLEGDEFIPGDHIELICNYLQSVEEGRITRLMVSVPPGSMKSRLCSILFPAWCLGRHPDWPILTTSHSEALAFELSRFVRDLCSEELFVWVFPHLKLRKDVAGTGRWMTDKNGGLKAAGVGANIAGFRAALGIIDDPLSEQTATSKVERERLIRWYPGGFRSRLLRRGRIIIIATRWADKDLIGHLLAEAHDHKDADQWKVVSIPALHTQESARLLSSLTEGRDKGPNERKHRIGESYWPEYLSTDDLLKTKASMPPSQWAALYLQNPIPEEGSVFHDSSFKRWIDDKPPKCSYVIQTVDAANTMATHSDYSVIQTWGLFEDIRVDAVGKEKPVMSAILLSNWRQRCEYPELRLKAIELYKKWEPDRMIIEKKSAGISLVQDLRRAEILVQEFLPDKDKLSRAAAITPLMEEGRVWIPDEEKKPWAKSLLDEALRFSRNNTHEFDDQVDSMVLAILFLKEGWFLTQSSDTVYSSGKVKKATTYWEELTG